MDRQTLDINRMLITEKQYEDYKLVLEESRGSFVQVEGVNHGSVDIWLGLCAFAAAMLGKALGGSVKKGYDESEFSKMISNAVRDCLNNLTHRMTSDRRARVFNPNSDVGYNHLEVTGLVEKRESSLDLQSVTRLTFHVYVRQREGSRGTS